LIEPTATVHRLKALGDGHIYVSATIPFTNDCLLYRSYDPLYTSLPECELTGLNITARPNPATEQVTFERSMTDKEGLLRFYNVNGTTIRKARFSKGQKQLSVNVSSWPGGMYLARIVNQGKTFGRVKFVVR
ncbi:MAG: T9SS type A sorting domain-containing protein, partial [Bacteroidales bacterium]|nr:T9SS type A sorting domain-containing protein [Bacteroidales bacterium]